ncbi:MAG: CDGSH iron-sulfur domain-containing protein, partial [Gemmatimonadota bacterium]
PIYASGDFVLLDADRRELSRESRAAFCRCGASLSKPFCDGRHVEAGFEDSGKLGVPKLRATGEADPTELTVRLRADGPLVLEGRFRIEGADGAAAKGAAGALCRCGASKNKPFCDGTHRNVGFAAEDPTAG